MQGELKGTILDLLKMHVKAKMPYKNITEINDVMNKKVHGDISYEECEDLIRYLYNKADSDQIMLRLEGYFVEKVSKSTSSNRRRPVEHSVGAGSKGRIEFGVFMQQVLNFQLKNH